MLPTEGSTIRANFNKRPTVSARRNLADPVVPGHGFRSLNGARAPLRVCEKEVLDESVPPVGFSAHAADGLTRDLKNLIQAI